MITVPNLEALIVRVVDRMPTYTTLEVEPTGCKPAYWHVPNVMNGSYRTLIVNAMVPRPMPHKGANDPRWLPSNFTGLYMTIDVVSSMRHGAPTYTAYPVEATRRINRPEVERWLLNGDWTIMPPPIVAEDADDQLQLPGFQPWEPEAPGPVNCECDLNALLAHGCPSAKGLPCAKRERP